MNPQFLKEAIKLAEKKLEQKEGGPFGAVIVKNGNIIARGWNRVTGTNDPTAHAEIMAIRAACVALNTFSLAGCEIYSNCEPCPMCLSAIYWARLDALYYAASREDAQDAGFDDQFLYDELKKEPDQRSLPSQQSLHSEAHRAFEKWKTMTEKMPY